MKQESRLNSLDQLPKSLQTSRLPGLDGLRGIAIILVLVSHVLRETKADNYPIGTAGVDIFFVISGFLITTLILKEKAAVGSVSLKRFYIRRALRIIPVSYLFLVVLLFLNYFFSLSVTHLSFLTAFLYLKNLPIHNAGEWYTGHFWSLSVEEQFYIIFPFLIVRSLKRYCLIIVSLLVLIPLVQLIGYSNLFGLQANKPIHLLTFTLINILGKGTVCILTGSLFSILAMKSVINIERLILPKWFGIVLLILATSLFIAYEKYYLSPIIFSVAIMVIVLNNLTQKNLLLSILESKVLVKLGVLSYSIYIWQQLFTIYQPWAKLFAWADSTFLNLSVLLLVAIGSYCLFELPFLRLKQRFKTV